jgi:hypothetical protein
MQLLQGIRRTQAADEGSPGSREAERRRRGGLNTYGLRGGGESQFVS